MLGLLCAVISKAVHTHNVFAVMCRCRVLDACGLFVLPSGVAALTSLTKLCVPTRAAWQTPRKLPQVGAWLLAAVPITSHMPCVNHCRWLSNNGLRQLPEEVGCLPALESL